MYRYGQPAKTYCRQSRSSVQIRRFAVISRVPVTASLAWPNTPSARSSERSQDQVAAPAESRTPNLHRASKGSHQSADGRVATERLGSADGVLHQKGVHQRLSSPGSTLISPARPQSRLKMNSLRSALTVLLAGQTL
jgi:hypothetical protein